MLLWIVFVSFLSEQSLGETSRPLNRAAAKGVEVQLDCSTQEPENGYWKYTRSSENNERMIYDGRKVVDDMKGLFVVNDSVQGSFNLNFHASESTSGLYTCQPDLNLADQSAEVIVLEPSPNCSVTKQTRDAVNASCSIDFSGNWSPELHWHSVSGRLETNETTIIPNYRVTSSLIVSLNETNLGVLYITCTAIFVLGSKPQDTTAANVPGLLSNCTLKIESSYDSSTQPTDTTPRSPLPYVIGIVCIALIVIAIIVVLLCMRRKRVGSFKGCYDQREVKPLAKPVQL